MDMSRKERQRMQHREEILCIARKMFADRGYQNVTVREIARESEFSTGTIYNLFGSKEALFSELLREPAHEIHRELVETLTSEKGEKDKVVDFIRRHTHVCTEYKEGFKLYYNTFRYGDSPLSRELTGEIEGLRKDVQRHIVDVVVAGVEKGVFKDFDPAVMTLVLRSSLEELLNMLLAGSNVEKMQAYARQFEVLFMGGILNND